jgi:DNA mismatch repair protein MutL
MLIKRLEENVINQIAAGEVIERPASAIKELIENSIDAGATRIEVVTVAGGKNLIRISDDGRGMSEGDLRLAVERHCTSKLSDDLLDIRTLGFRGEALPSIGAVSKLSIRSRTEDGESAYEINVRGGEIEGPKPAALTKGTVVEVRDLFYATPARLKFLKSDRAESTAIADMIKRIAMAFPEIRFSYSASERKPIEYPACLGEAGLLERIGQILGSDFKDNAILVNAEREGARLYGFAAVPTYNRGNAQHQFLYVNGRPVKDRSLSGAIRGAYMDYLPRDRHPVLALFLETAPQQVDVNVHPAKSDVRFRDPGMIRGLLVGALRQVLAEQGHRASTHNAGDMLAAFAKRTQSENEAQREAQYAARSNMDGNYQPTPNQNFNWQNSANRPLDYGQDYVPAASMPSNSNSNSNIDSGGFREDAPVYQVGEAGSYTQPMQEHQSRMDGMDVVSSDVRANETKATPNDEKYPLGVPRAQLHKNYIVSQTEDGLVIVDQHAAHERLVYEAMKNALAENGIASQGLLIPEVVDLEEDDIDRLMVHAEGLSELGLGIERFGTGAIAVRETPAILGEVNVQGLIMDLVDEIAEWGTSELVKDKIDHVAATMACYGSVRSGRILRSEEMDALLREMEETPNSGQCNHGRPTYVSLKLSDIEKLFGRR